MAAIYFLFLVWKFPKTNFEQNKKSQKKFQDGHRGSHLECQKSSKSNGWHVLTMTKVQQPLKCNRFFKNNKMWKYNIFNRNKNNLKKIFFKCKMAAILFILFFSLEIAQNKFWAKKKKSKKFPRWPPWQPSWMDGHHFLFFLVWKLPKTKFEQKKKKSKKIPRWPPWQPSWMSEISQKQWVACPDHDEGAYQIWKESVNICDL